MTATLARLCPAHAGQRDRWLHAEPATVTRAINAIVGTPLVQVGTATAAGAADAISRRGRAWRELVQTQAAGIAAACRTQTGCGAAP